MGRLLTGGQTDSSLQSQPSADAALYSCSCGETAPQKNNSVQLQPSTDTALYSCSSIEKK